MLQRNLVSLYFIGTLYKGYPRYFPSKICIAKFQSDQIALQEDLVALENWAETWGMRFNAKKCYIMHISPKRHKSAHMYSLSGQILESVSDNPYLGLQIFDDLKWNKHIRITVNKASIAQGMLRRNLNFLPKNLESTAYISLVR